MSELINFIAFIIVLLSFATIIYLYVHLRLSHMKLLKDYSMAKIESETYKKKLTDQISNKENKKIEQTEGFVKFISQSRDMAFSYIEEVQAAIADYDDSVGAMVQYYKETGKLPAKKPSDIMKRFAEAHEKLMQSMPKDNV